LHTQPEERALGDGAGGEGDGARSNKPVTGFLMMGMSREGKGRQHASIEQPARRRDGHGRELSLGRNLQVTEVIVVLHAFKVFEGKARATRGNEEAGERIAVGLGVGGSGWRYNGGAEKGVDLLGKGNVAGAGAGGGDLVEVGVESDGKAHGDVVV